MPLTGKEMVKLALENGWVEVRQRGSHHHFKHPSKKGVVTVPHPTKDLHPKTVNSILKQAGLK